MIVTVLADILLKLVFLLGGVFFAMTLPVKYAVAVCVPLAAMLIFYMKLERLETSMDEARRELDVFRKDNRFLVWGLFAGVLVVGIVLMAGFTKDLQLLPIAEAKTALKRFEKIENLDAIAEKLNQSEKRLLTIEGNLNLVKENLGRIEVLLMKEKKPVATVTDKANLETLKSLERILTDIKKLLSNPLRGENP